MTTTQHTAGPWRVFDAFTNPEIVTDRPTACETESLVQFKGQKNAKANARLMAAAPELLDALEELHFVTDSKTSGRSLEDARELAAKAIAKAKGGAA